MLWWRRKILLWWRRQILRLYSTVNIKSSCITIVPSLSTTDFTFPALNAVTVVSIFMASMINQGSFSCTFCPRFTNTLYNAPCKGAPIWLVLAGSHFLVGLLFNHRSDLSNTSTNLFSPFTLKNTILRPSSLGMPTDNSRTIIVFPGSSSIRVSSRGFMP